MIINSFSGPYRWLSNFWMILIPYEGITFPSTEHAYQAAKTTNIDKRFWISQMTDGPPVRACANAKRAGNKLDIRDDWEDVKLSVMEEVLRQKFNLQGSHKHIDLCHKLMNTHGEQLIEGNDWGNVYWGVCRGKGHNNLGKLLMKIRQDLIAGVMV
jgi:ribA/ribD-fused uncharacterized protein